MKYAFLEFLVVGLAGAIGAMTRLALSRLLNAPNLPFGTLFINLSGSFLLGWFLTAYGDSLRLNDLTRLAIAVGFIGTYTTFSTYMFETDALFRENLPLRALFYLFASIALGLLAVRLGIIVGRRA